MILTDARIDAFSRLGVDPHALSKIPHITSELRRIHRAIKGSGMDARNIPADPIYFLNTSDDPDARRFLEVYYTLPKVQRKLLPIEAFCAAAAISPLRILELVTVSCVRLGAQASTIIAAVNHPRVVEKTVEMALTDEGIEDRTLLHKATGFLPTPKGAQTTIHLQQTAQATAAANAQNAQLTSAPVPENTIRRMVDRFNRTTPSLPPTSATPFPDADVIPEAEAILVSNDSDADDDASLL